MTATITLVSVERTETTVRKQYRIHGEPTSPEWRASLRAGRIAWCEFGIWNDSGHLASYGGEVWPGAWPELFEALPDSVQEGAGRIRLTEAGRVMVAVAEEIANGAAPALRTNQTIRELGGQS